MITPTNAKDVKTDLYLFKGLTSFNIYVFAYNFI